MPLCTRYAVHVGTLVCLSRQACGGAPRGDVSLGLSRGNSRRACDVCRGDSSTSGASLYDGGQDGVHHNALHCARPARGCSARTARPHTPMVRCVPCLCGRLLPLCTWRGHPEHRGCACLYLLVLLDGADSLDRPLCTNGGRHRAVLYGDDCLHARQRRSRRDL